MRGMTNRRKYGVQIMAKWMCIHYAGECIRPACIRKHKVNCCLECFEACNNRCRKTTETRRRCVSIGDKVNVSCEVVGLVNDGFDCYAIVRAGKDHMMVDADTLILFKYEGGEMNEDLYFGSCDGS